MRGLYGQFCVDGHRLVTLICKNVVSIHNHPAQLLVGKNRAECGRVRYLLTDDAAKLLSTLSTLGGEARHC